MSGLRRGRAVAFLLVAAAVACGDGASEAEGPWTSPIPFDTAFAWIHTPADSVRILIELAESDAQRQFGLMTRPSLDSMSGMLFRYETDQPGNAGFYMYRTRVPLDIAFLDSAGTVDTILAMPPCESPYPASCPIYGPGGPYRAALEVNLGWFERHGVGPGARVRLVEAQQNGAADRP